MVRGEDGMLWCEQNNMGQKEADDLVIECMQERFENAIAWIETEAPPSWDDCYYESDARDIY